MKPVIPILFGMLFLVCVFSGCAGSPARSAENTAPEEQKTYEIISTPFGDVKREKKQTDQRAVEAGSEKADIDKEGYETIWTPLGDVKRGKTQAGNQATAPVPEKTYLDEQGMYEIISTPFGLIKRKKKQADKATAMPAPEPVAPEVAVSPEPEPAVLPDPESASAVLTGSKPEPAVLTASEVEPVAPPAPVAVSPEATPADEAPDETGEISFDFDDADLGFVIRAMADFLQINYIVDPGITGKVTIHTAGNLKSSDVFPIFHQTLEINGLAAVREGNVYRILRLKDASRMPIISRFALDSKAIPPGERTVLQIIPLKFISAQEVTKVITPFISAEGTIISEGSSNSLLVVDKGINIFKILKLVEVFDVNVFDKTNYRFYEINNADAEEVSKTLEMILPPVTADGKGQMKFIPIRWLNSLLVVSSSLEVFDRVDPLIRQLDVPSEGAQPQIYVYSVKNGMAVDLGDTMRAIFGGGGGVPRAFPEGECAHESLCQGNQRGQRGVAIFSGVIFNSGQAGCSGKINGFFGYFTRRGQDYRRSDTKCLDYRSAFRRLPAC